MKSLGIERMKMNNDNNYNPSLNNSNSNMTINTQLNNQSDEIIGHYHS